MFLERGGLLASHCKGLTAAGQEEIVFSAQEEGGLTPCLLLALCAPEDGFHGATGEAQVMEKMKHL